MNQPFVVEFVDIEDLAVFCKAVPDPVITLFLRPVSTQLERWVEIKALVNGYYVKSVFDDLPVSCVAGLDVFENESPPSVHKKVLRLVYKAGAAEVAKIMKTCGKTVYLARGALEPLREE